VQKTLYPGPHLALITPCLLASTSAAKNYDGYGESWNVFTKGVLVENTLAVTCVKIQGGTPPLAPSVDAHVF